MFGGYNTDMTPLFNNINFGLAASAASPLFFAPQPAHLLLGERIPYGIVIRPSEEELA